jgi:hypothetical protein
MHDRILDVETPASSGWIRCENTSLVSQSGCFDSSHADRSSACRRREATCLARASGLRAATRPIRTPDLMIKYNRVITSLEWGKTSKPEVQNPSLQGKEIEPNEVCHRPEEMSMTRRLGNPLAEINECNGDLTPTAGSRIPSHDTPA